jgi:hypothetical protein
MKLFIAGLVICCMLSGWGLTPTILLCILAVMMEQRS